MTRPLLSILLLTWFALPQAVTAQHQLEKKIPFFSVHKASPEEALRRLGEQGGVHFSYKTDILQEGNSVSVSAANSSIGQLLHLLFHDEYEYGEQQDFIIVTRRSSYFIIKGHVTDKATGKAMDSVLVATPYRAFATLTDQAGAFRLKIPVTHPLDHIVLMKEFYRDVFIQLKNTGDREIDVQMQAAAVHELPPVTSEAAAEGNAKAVRAHPLFNIRRGSTGFEAGGIFNFNEGNAYNFQLAGALNIVGKSMKGVQVAGIHNLVMDTAKGLQIAGLVNKADGPVKGIQLAAVNHAHKLKGLQIGVINIADSSDGVSIGLLNFVRNAGGYHSLSLYATDIANTNLAFKLGNARLYTVFMAGMNVTPGRRLYTLGIGLGNDILIGNRVAISTEASFQGINAGSWDNRLLQAKTALNVRILKGFSLFAGPTFNYYTTSQQEIPPGYKGLGITGYKESRRWIGWQAGITAADLLWPEGKQYVYREKKWSVQAAMGGGLSYDTDNRAEWISGDIRVQRAVVDNSILVMLTTAVNHRFVRREHYYNINWGPYGDTSQAVTNYALKAGLKVFVIRKFYAAAELGVVSSETPVRYSNSETDRKMRMLLSPSLGWLIGQRWDISARIENIQAAMFLRLGYTLWKSGQ
jgi:hypothetical protein